MTRDEWADEVQRRARAQADAAGVVWPSKIHLHDRTAGDVVYRYAVSVHADPDPQQATLILWSGRSDSEVVRGQVIGQSLWQQIQLGAEGLGW